MPSPILVVNRLTTRLRIGEGIYSAVDEVSFQLYQGKTLALVGESGSGKTLAGLSILRILPPPAMPSEGEVLYHRRNLLTLSENEMRQIRGAKIAMIFQDPSSALNPVYTIGEQLAEVAILHLNMDQEEAEQRVLETLQQVGMPEAKRWVDKYPHQLSGGMKQRAMIAMALMCEPDILIADEPTTALDVTIQAQVLQLIKELQRNRGMALLLITHDMGIVAELADDVAVMYASQIMERGDVFKIFDQMAHPYTIGLFQSQPSLNIQRGELHAIRGYVPPLTHYPKGCRFHPRCPFAMPKCKHGAVPYFSVDSDDTHESKCWLQEPGNEQSKI